MVRESAAPRRSPHPVVFRYLLVLESGEPCDPAVFVTATPTCNEGDLFVPRGGERFRVVAIEPAMDDEAPFHATWTVETFPGERAGGRDRSWHRRARAYGR